VSANGLFSWQAGATPGEEQVTVRVTDSGGLSAERTFKIVVSLPVNTAPTLAPVADQPLLTGAGLTLTLVGSDAEDAADALVYSLVSGPAGAVVSADGKFTWQAGVDPGEQLVSVRVTDSGGLSADASFKIVVSLPPNTGPVLAPIADQSVYTEDTVTVTLVGSDAEDAADALVYSLVSGPAGAQVSADGVFAWQTGTTPSTDTVTVRVTDSGGLTADVSFRILVAERPNVAPELTAPVGVAVNEGSTLSLQLQAADPAGPLAALKWTLVSAPAGATLSDSGVLGWLAADGDATAQFTVRIDDGKGGSDEETFTISVADVAPTLSAGGGASTVVNETYTIALGSTDPGQDTPVEWIIDWGDGSATTSIGGSASAASHQFATAGQFNVTARLRNEDGTFVATPFSVGVAPLLHVNSASIAGGSIHVTFDGKVDAAHSGAQFVDLTGSLTGKVTARVTFDADGAGIVLTRADGQPLQYDLYTLVLTDLGFVSTLGAVLDGDANGRSGGDYRTTLLYAGATPGLAQLPDFMRGPGEHVDVPLEAHNGLQVHFASTGGVKTLTFTVGFDPALLHVNGVARGADLPAGAQMTWQVVPDAGGKLLLRITIVSDVAIAAGNVHLVSLDAVVPENAPYGSSEILPVTVERINNAAPVGAHYDEALQLVAFDSNPYLPRIENSVPEVGELFWSTIPDPERFPPLTYGLEEAVARWSGAIWATKTMSADQLKARQAYLASLAGKGAPAANGQQQPTTPSNAAKPGDSTGTPSAPLDPPGTPPVVHTGNTAAAADAPNDLAATLAGFVEELAGNAEANWDKSLFAIALPMIRLNPAEDKEQKRRKRRKEKVEA
jgi:hypothetical protein